MDITVDRKKLFEMLRSAETAKPTRTTIEALNYIRLTASSAELEVAGSSPEQSLVLTAPWDQVGGTMRFPGAVLLPTRVLDILREAGGHEVAIRSDGRAGIVIECGWGVWTLQTEDTFGFKLLEPTEGVEAAITEAGLVRLLSQAVVACSAGRDNSAMEGVLLHRRTNGDIVAVGTDSKILIQSVWGSRELGGCTEFRAVLQRQTVKMLTAVLDPKSERLLTLCCSGNLISVAGDGVFVTAKLLLSKFPAYEKVLKSQTEQPEFKLDCNREQLLSAVRQMLAVGADAAQVTIHPEATRVGFAALDVEKTVGSAVATVDGVPHVGPGKRVVILTSTDYASDAASTLTGTLVELSGKGPDMAVVLKETDGTCTALWMPLAADRGYKLAGSSKKK